MPQVAPEARKMASRKSCEFNRVVFEGEICRILLQNLSNVLAIFVKHRCNSHSEAIGIYASQILSAIEIRIVTLMKKDVSDKYW
ncbi:hypothetical protein KKH3_28490 [Pectobacterium actinidiae]|nr:hypothetical protein KKH3_28490 [Pectobacterium actinidiae]